MLRTIFVLWNPGSMICTDTLNGFISRLKINHYKSLFSYLDKYLNFEN